MVIALGKSLWLNIIFGRVLKLPDASFSKLALLSSVFLFYSLFVAE